MKRLTLAQVDDLLERVNEIAVDVDWSKYGLPFYPSKGGDIRPRRGLRKAVRAWYAEINEPQTRRKRVGVARGESEHR